MGIKFSCSYGGRNKVQKLVGCFSENQTFCKLLIAIPLKMYTIDFGQPNDWLNDQLLLLAPSYISYVWLTAQTL